MISKVGGCQTMAKDQGKFQVGKTAMAALGFFLAM
jgi:hypothetical protein